MEKLIKGLHQFQSEIFGEYEGLFARLQEGQNPEALVITCSDSRINPHLITQSKPGDLFVLRNAGNIVAPFCGQDSGEWATIEYAVCVLGIRDIIICGHSNCGAMSGVLNPPSVDGLPSVSTWLEHSAPTRDLIRTNYAHLDESATHATAVQENVLLQVEHLRTHPMIEQALIDDRVNLHAWVYVFETAEVLAFNVSSGQYEPLLSSAGAASGMFGTVNL